MLAAPLAVATAAADNQCTPISLCSNDRQCRSRFAQWRVSFALAAQPRMTCPLLDDSAHVASTRARARCDSSPLSPHAPVPSVIPRISRISSCHVVAAMAPQFVVNCRCPCKDAVDRFLLAHCMACVIRRGRSNECTPNVPGRADDILTKPLSLIHI